MMSGREHNEASFDRRAAVARGTVGRDATVAPFALICAGARIGERCTIDSHVHIGSDVRLAESVTVQAGAVITGQVAIGAGGTVGPHATLDGARGAITVQDGATIGAGATIHPNITIGREAEVAAGAVIDHDVPAFAIVAGNPARITGYVGAGPVAATVSPGPKHGPCHVRGVEWLAVSTITDMRGRLAVAESGAGLPFEPKRYFVVHDVPSREARGEHAHRTLHQVLTCVRGECSIIVDDGTRRERLLLDTPGAAVHIHPLVWAAQFGFSDDAVLLVLGSDVYDPEDYIRDYDEFLRIVGNRCD